MKPLISIVIANYNYGQFLEAAIRSVVEQDGFDKCELIICDAASSDNSVEIIKKYSDSLAWWCSEKDKGQSDAFNKGFLHASGKYLSWLNADDALIPGSLKKIITYLEAHPGLEWLSGGVVHCDAAMKVVDARIGAQPPAFMVNWFTMTEIGGPSTFFTKKRLLEVGGIDIDLHYLMDIDLWYKFFYAGMKLRHLDHYFWAFRWHELSKTSLKEHKGNTAPRYWEEILIIDKRYHRVPLKIKLGRLYWRMHKSLNGSFYRSIIDSKRFSGRVLTECFE